MNNIKSKKDDFNPIINHQLTSLGDRIKTAIIPTSQRSFAKVWKKSFVTLNHYITGRSTPSINDLIDIAQLTNTDFLWLLTGHHYTQNQSNWLKSKQFIELCPDGSMIPTLFPNVPVLLEAMYSNETIVDGLYCLESSKGKIFRRLQWDEEQQGYWLLCDNALFLPRLSKTPQIVGKVLGAMTPIV